MNHKVAQTGENRNLCNFLRIVHKKKSSKLYSELLIKRINIFGHYELFCNKNELPWYFFFFFGNFFKTALGFCFFFQKHTACNKNLFKRFLIKQEKRNKKMSKHYLALTGKNAPFNKAICEWKSKIFVTCFVIIYVEHEYFSSNFCPDSVDRNLLLMDYIVHGAKCTEKFKWIKKQFQVMLNRRTQSQDFSIMHNLDCKCCFEGAIC